MGESKEREREREHVLTKMMIGEYDFCVLVLVCLVATKMREKLGTFLQNFFFL